MEPPPKKPPARAAALRDNSRQAQQKAVLLGEVSRLHWAKGGSKLLN